MLLYGLLHLSGYDLSLSDIENFRQWESKTPGHPEFGHTVGVEATTGPLGQGISNAVGMALSAKMLAARFNGIDRFDPIGHRIFVLTSDGDMMEGVSGEASSLAGHLGLGNLIVLYDDNQITIEGRTDLAFSEDVAGRYESYGWTAQRVDGHDHEAIAGAIEAAISETAAFDHPVSHTHRPRCSDQTGLLGLPRIATRSGRDRGGEGGTRLADGADLLHPGRGQGVLQGTGRRGSGPAHGVGREAHEWSGRHPRRPFCGMRCGARGCPRTS